MIDVRPASSRFSADSGWLRSNFSFSFGPYNDPDNTRFGPMRVLNDDFIAPQKGFGAHPHSDMEVVSIVLTGQLRHADNLGNIGVTSWGEVQRMTAGTGIIHTEFSASDAEELNLLQMWFMPDHRGLPPSYEITRFDPESLYGQWVPVVSNRNPSSRVAAIHQDMTIYLSRVATGESLQFETSASRRIFLFVIEGKVTINGEHVLGERDSARMAELAQLDVQAEADALVMLIDLP